MPHKYKIRDRVKVTTKNLLGTGFYEGEIVEILDIYGSCVRVIDELGEWTGGLTLDQIEPLMPIRTIGIKKGSCDTKESNINQDILRDLQRKGYPIEL